MIITLLLYEVLFAAFCSALLEGFEGSEGNPFNYQVTSTPFKLPAIDRSSSAYIECSRKVKKVTLESDSVAFFRSPDYPNTYPNNTMCRWNFKGKENITIQCLDVKLERAKKGKCPNDLLSIDSEEYCGSHKHLRYDGKKSIKVQFRSNMIKTYRGFYCIAHPTSEGPQPCKCGQSNSVTRIVGGKETKENEYPWQAALVAKGTTNVFCGGSIIASKHILTAAHCAASVYDFQVLVGAYSLTDPASAQLRLTPYSFIGHENHDWATNDNDIAIIELEGRIRFTTEVMPVCLPANDKDTYDDVDAVVTGWGRIEYGGSKPDVLMGVVVPTMQNSKCQKYYKKEVITENMICAGYKKGEKDSCHGDSGGPLSYIQGTGLHTQIGVVSWGHGCASPRNTCNGYRIKHPQAKSAQQLNQNIYIFSIICVAKYKR